MTPAQRAQLKLVSSVVALGGFFVCMSAALVALSPRPWEVGFAAETDRPPTMDCALCQVHRAGGVLEDRDRSAKDRVEWLKFRTPSGRVGFIALRRGDAETRVEIAVSGELPADGFPGKRTFVSGLYENLRAACGGPADTIAPQIAPPMLVPPVAVAEVLCLNAECPTLEPHK